MKQRGEELLVINRKIFYLILLSIGISGIVVGYVIGYIFTPTKEIYIQKNVESEKTVLPATVETAFAKKSETSPTNPVQTQKAENIEEKKPESIPKDSADKPEIRYEHKKQTQETEKFTLKDIPLNQEQQSSNIKKPIKRKYAKIPYYTIQLGAFSEIANTNKLKEELTKAGYKVSINKEDLYKVRIGRFEKFSQAKQISSELNSKGFNNFIIKISKSSAGGKQ